MLDRKEIIINNDYQRSAGLWPDSARSYFIDTILEEYPFPNIYLYQTYNEKTKKPVREVVDGQQRLSTIDDFKKNKLKLTSVSSKYHGMTFADLPDDKIQLFLTASVRADIILAAEPKELLDMFRRMNAFTLPLNYAEQRNSEFQGEFKWFINEQSDSYAAALERFKVFAPRQMLRMADSEFLTELVMVLDHGITSKADRAIKSIYHKYDEVFPEKAKYKRILREFFTLLDSEFVAVKNTFITKPYAMYSLFCAFAQAKHGIPEGVAQLGAEPIGRAFKSKDKAIKGLLELAAAHEAHDLNGKYGSYVDACLKTTTKAAQRVTRAKWMLKMLLQE
jgi:Protein of unknown function DUF262